MKKHIGFVVFSCLIICTIIAAGIYMYNEKLPVPYKEEIAEISRLYDVPPEIIYAVIKTESNFDENAKSSSGACGLMQIMPETFDEIAFRLKENTDKSEIFDYKTNIKYGSFYLSYLYKNLGNWDLVFASYNAGIGRVKSWLKDSRYSDDGSNLKEIPYSETKAYVDKINKYKEKYKKIIKE